MDIVETQILTITGDETADRQAIQTGAAIIRAGGLVAFPTETVYGLGADALNEEALRKIFVAKERPDWDPLIVHVCSRGMLDRLIQNPPLALETLVERFMPGPLTLILPKAPHVSSLITAGRPTLAVRMPSHPVALALIEASDTPIAAPSANRFSRPSPTRAEHVLQDLQGRIEAVIDAGPTEVGVESTILDLTTMPPTLLRPGGVPEEALEAMFGTLQRLQPGSVKAGAPLPSPGLSERHYAPQARLILMPGEGGETPLRIPFEGSGSPFKLGFMLPSHFPQGWRLRLEQDSLIVAWHPDPSVLSLESETQADTISLSLPDRTTLSFPAPRQSDLVVLFHWGLWQEKEKLAQRLFEGLRWLDRQGVSHILCPLPETGGLGTALRDRLLRASRQV